MLNSDTVKYKNGYACSIIYVNNKTQVQVAFACDYKHNIYINNISKSK